MRILQPLPFALLAGLLTVGIVGCSEQKPDGGASTADSGGSGENGSGRAASAPTQTPAGRTELPTVRTVAPNLWITLPKGFSVRADTTLDYDLLVVSRTDDPLLSDTNEIPYGMLRIVVGDSLIQVTPTDVKSAERPGIIGAYPGRWRYYTGVIPAGATYYSYELAGNDFFARIGPEQELKDLHLHLYIAGKDTAVIRQLITAAESISIKP